MEISLTQNVSTAQAWLRQDWDCMIFLSPNAVHYAAGMHPPEAWQTTMVAAVGASSAKTLSQIGRPVDLLPDQGFDSEGLLALAELAHPVGKRILIVRGEGGRALLGETLKLRGADVAYAEVYRRIRPERSAAPLLQRWRQDIQLVTVTSNEVLNNLVAMLGESGWPSLSRTPLIVVSERMYQEAERLGFSRILRAEGADDRSLIKAICKWADVDEHR
jgi:uroporphyrinogen-III synthase